MTYRGLVRASVVVAAIAAACSGGKHPGPDPIPAVEPPVRPTVVLAGAGDIAQCDNDGGRHAVDTGRLLDRIAPDAVFTVGDNAYFSGSAREFAECYDPAWGRVKSKTWPSPGNHEFESAFGTPYFQYFGSRAGPSGLGFYSYTLGNWRVLSLNSLAPIGAGSEQLQWIQDDLAANPTKCALAYWHHPRFTSGPSGGGDFRELWRVLQGLGVDIVVNGHDHLYERFALQNPDALADPTGGMREFIVGTGGATLYGFNTPARNSTVRLNTYGVLKLTLRADSYDFAFIEAGTEATRDADTNQACH